VGQGQPAGGEAHHQALEAAGGAPEAGAERDDEKGETRLAEQAARNEGDEAGDDEAEPTGEVGGEGLDRDGGRGLHETIPSIKRRVVQGKDAWGGADASCLTLAGRCGWRGMRGGGGLMRVAGAGSGNEQERMGSGCFDAAVNVSS
jgi:hypothetical protein